MVGSRAFISFGLHFDDMHLVYINKRKQSWCTVCVFVNKDSTAPQIVYNGTIFVSSFK